MPKTPSRYSRQDPARFQKRIGRGFDIRRRATRDAGGAVTDIAFSVNFFDFDKFQQELFIMGRRAQGVVNRMAVRAGMKPLRMKMRRLAPRHKTVSKRTGRTLKKTRSSALGKSIGNNGPITYRNTGITVGYVGARRSYRVGNKKPSRYAHLVEKGHQIRFRPYRSKKGARAWAWIRPRPFVEPALRQTKSTSLMAMRRVYAQQIFKRTGKTLGNLVQQAA